MTTALADKPAEVKPVCSTEAAPQDYHWTVDAFYRAIAAGVFNEPAHLELIHGRIIDNMSQNPPHRSTRVRIGRRLRAALEPRFFVVDECPVHIASDGEPTPDVVVVNGSEADYEERHPTPDDVQLLIEVSDTTVAFDTGEKALLYAQAGIAEYWVVLLEARAIRVHREPTPNGYMSVMQCGQSDKLAPRAAPEILLPVRELLNG